MTFNFENKDGLHVGEKDLEMALSYVGDDGVYQMTLKIGSEEHGFYTAYINPREARQIVDGIYDIGDRIRDELEEDRKIRKLNKYLAMEFT